MEFTHYGYFYQLSIYFSYLFYLHQGATQTPIKILFLSILHYIYQYFFGLSNEKISYFINYLFYNNSKFL